MIRAWRRPDGRYRLEFSSPMDAIPLEHPSSYGAERDASTKSWSVPEESLPQLEAEKVFGVITGPSSCGCEPAMFRWVTEGEVQAGRTPVRPCGKCKSSARIDLNGHSITCREAHWCDIIDVCGEADVAMSVYEAEFKGGVEATR